MDDIIIFSYTLEEHLEHINKAFALFKDSGIKLSPLKCRIAEEKIDFLGYQIDNDGISVNHERIKPIQNWAIPKNKKEVQRFLGAM